MIDSKLWLSHLCGLLDDAVPHLIWQEHVLFYKMLLNSLISLCPDHITHCLIEGVHLQTQRNGALEMQFCYSNYQHPGRNSHHKIYLHSFNYLTSSQSSASKFSLSKAFLDTLLRL